MARSTCAAIRPLLSALIDDLLPADERSAVESHLATCAACRRRLAEYRAIGRAIGSLPQVEPPAGLERDLRRRLEQYERDEEFDALPVEPEHEERRRA
ncbi:MAG TPA: zf-HC2 domain-containing protein [Candidatus Limnocylindria bacterium]|nr:zf-HC2 domain-containing protein [Candidatus Limnocylindria bacterium]